jgi:hypothetical protein
MNVQHRVDVGVDARVVAAHGLDLGLGEFQRLALAVQRLVHVADDRDLLGGEVAPLQARQVDGAQRHRVAVGHHERRHVLAHVRLEADHRVRAHVHELVHARQAADDGPVAHVHVAGQRDAVGQHRAVAQRARRAPRGRRP